MNYALKFISPEGEAKYVDRLNGISEPRFTVYGEEIRIYTEAQAEKALASAKKFLKSPKARNGGYDGYRAELEEIRGSVPQNQQLIDELPADEPFPNFSKRFEIKIFGISFDMSINGRHCFYRCRIGEEVIAMKKDVRIVAEILCRILYRTIVERAEKYEQKKADLQDMRSDG